MKVPGWLQVAVAAGAGAAAFLALAVGLALRVAPGEGRMQDVPPELVAEAVAFGRGTTAEGCVREALERLDGRSDYVELVRHRRFLKACLGATGLPPGFCTGVPSRDELNLTLSYLEESCARRNHPDSRACQGLLQAVWEVCNQPPETKGPAPR
jgi:hypothetical protein